MPMNTHPVTNEDVMAYLDGELSPEAAAEMTAHLTQCRACQDVAADLQGVSRQLSGWAVETAETASELPSNLATAIEARAAGRAKKPGSRWRTRAFAWTAAVAMAVVILIPALVRRSSDRMAITGNHADLKARFPTPLSSRSMALEQPLMSSAQHAERYSSAPPAPLVVRTAELRLTAQAFDSLRVEVDRILLQFGGHIAQLNIASPTGEARSLTATLRIPSPQLEAALTELRKLGHVEGESQGGEEVTQQSVDLEARLNNARRTEERLTQILATRTGKLSDVLEVEEKLSQVRGEIEQAEAEQKSLNNRVSFATVSLQVSEDYRTPLAGDAPSSVGTRLSNAAVDGMHVAFNGFIGLLQAFLAVGPSLLLLGIVLGLPAYFLWKKLRHR
jgi:hypothetical protein